MSVLRINSLFNKLPSSNTLYLQWLPSRLISKYFVFVDVRASHGISINKQNILQAAILFVYVYVGSAIAQYITYVG